MTIENWISLVAILFFGVIIPYLYRAKIKRRLCKSTSIYEDGKLKVPTTTVIFVIIIMWLFITAFVGIVLYSTSVEIVSGGFYDPKAIILLPNETRNVEISTESIISQDVFILLTINDKRIAAAPVVNYYIGNENKYYSHIFNLYGDEYTTGLLKQKTNNEKAKFYLRILDSSIPPGEYELKILIKPASYPYLTSTYKIPIYIGYHIKDE